MLAHRRMEPGSEVLRHPQRGEDVGWRKWRWMCGADVLQEQGVTMPHLESHTYPSRWISFWGSHPLRLAPDTDGCGIPKAGLVPQTCADRAPTGATRQEALGDLFCFLLDRHKWSCSQQSLQGHIRQDEEQGSIYRAKGLSREEEWPTHQDNEQLLTWMFFFSCNFWKFLFLSQGNPFFVILRKGLLICILWA